MGRQLVSQKTDWRTDWATSFEASFRSMTGEMSCGLGVEDKKAVLKIQKGNSADSHRMGPRSRWAETTRVDVPYWRGGSVPFVYHQRVKPLIIMACLFHLRSFIGSSAIHWRIRRVAG